MNVLYMIILSVDVLHVNTFLAARYHHSAYFMHQSIINSKREHSPRQPPCFAKDPNPAGRPAGICRKRKFSGAGHLHKKMYFTWIVLISLFNDFVCDS